MFVFYATVYLKHFQEYSSILKYFLALHIDVQAKALSLTLPFPFLQIFQTTWLGETKRIFFMILITSQKVSIFHSTYICMTPYSFTLLCNAVHIIAYMICIFILQRENLLKRLRQKIKKRKRRPKTFKGDWQPT